MRKLIRPVAQLQWLNNALCVRQGHKLMVLPFGEGGLELKLETSELDHLQLVAIPSQGEPRPLATFTSERQAQRLLNQLQGTSPSLGTWLMKAGVVAAIGFAAWFLFVLPIDAEFTTQHPSRWLDETSANGQHQAVRQNDPMLPARAAQALEAASTQLSPQPAPASIDREQQLQQAFGLRQ